MNASDLGGTPIKDEKIAKLKKKEASERTLKNQARREITELKILLQRAKAAIEESGYEDFDYGLMSEIDKAT